MMNNLKTIVTILALILTFSVSAQVAPKGKKTLKVKEMHENEYWKSVTTEGLGDMLIDQFYKVLPRKLNKYGFNDITIKEVGKVSDIPELRFQVNIIDNNTGNLFKIRLTQMTHSPKYIIKESKPDYSNYITETKDKFTDKITYRSPLTETISFTKVKEKDRVSTYMYISVFGSSVSVNKKGVIILFDDKTKINRPNVEIKAKVNRHGSGYVYSAFFSLSDEEIEELTQKKITDVRLYIYDSEIKDGVKYQEYLKCISNK